MRRFFMLLVVALALPATALAASETGNGLRGFGTGEVTISHDGVITLANDPGEYSGVYLPGWLRGNPKLTEIDEMSFDVFSSTVLNPSSPRISLPLDLDADGDTDAWAYLSAYYCYSTGKPQIYGFLPVNFLLPCPIYTSLGDGPHAGLGALAAAYPGARVAADNYVFVILDDSPATAELRNVRIGRVSTP